MFYIFDVSLRQHFDQHIAAVNVFITLELSEDESRAQTESWILQTGAGEAHSAGPGSLYQLPAGKLSEAAELPWTDTRAGRDVDDKGDCLKWFSSEAQRRESDIKAHTKFFSLYVLHTHPSLTLQHMNGSHTVLAVVKSVFGPVSVLIILFSLFYCLWQC